MRSHCLILLAQCVLHFSALAVLRAETRWPDERQAGLFHCHADFALAPHQPLLDELSLLEQELRSTIGAPPSREPVHLFLFQASGTYQAYMRQYFPAAPRRRALFIKARGPGMVFAQQGTDFEIDVRHESTHALLHAWLPSVPLWLDEGLAEYFEVPSSERKRHHPHLAALKALARQGALPRLEDVESVKSLDEMGRDEYRIAWAWVHFLLHGPPPAKAELLHYLSSLQAGVDPGPLSPRLRNQLPNLDRLFAEHFQP